MVLDRRSRESEDRTLGAPPRNCNVSAYIQANGGHDSGKPDWTRKSQAGEVTMSLCLRKTTGMKRLHFNGRVERTPTCHQSPIVVPRRYITGRSASSPATPTRKQVTVVSDDGRVRWQDLSRREKAARTTQQTFNFGLVLSGVVLTVCLSVREESICHLCKAGRRHVSSLL